MQRPQEVMTQLNSFGELIFEALVLMVIAMAAIVLLYKLVSKYLLPHAKHKRILQVSFGAIYALVLASAVLLALQSIGHDVSGLAGMVLLAVIIGAVLIFFLIPFLPVLPFKLGDMVSVNGIMGVIDTITTYHTMIRTFDGQVVFIPNAVVFASTIGNFNHTPNRRVDLIVEVTPSSDLVQARDTLLLLMESSQTVLSEPAPSAFIAGINGERSTIECYCWVKNADWLDTRSQLWLDMVGRFKQTPDVDLAVARSDVKLVEQA
jgi:small conductance mechanosensitive channel